MPTLRRRRIRRTLKWAGLVLSLVIAVMWVVSRWHVLLYCYWSPSGRQDCYLLEVGWGTLRVMWSRELFGPPGVRILPPETPAWSWGPQASRRPDWWDFTLPLWIPFLLIALPTAILFWRDRRRFPPGHCQHCGYNLTHNISGTCPECGTPAPKQTANATGTVPPTEMNDQA